MKPSNKAVALQMMTGGKPPKNEKSRAKLAAKIVRLKMQLKGGK